MYLTYIGVVRPLYSSFYVGSDNEHLMDTAREGKGIIPWPHEGTKRRVGGTNLNHKDLSAKGRGSPSRLFRADLNLAGYYSRKNSTRHPLI